MDLMSRGGTVFGFLILLIEFTVTVTDKTVCSNYLVSGIDGVDDIRLTSSSDYLDDHEGHGPHHARLHAEGQISSAWVPDIFDGNQYIQTEFRRVMDVTAVLLQGRKELGKFQFVTFFSISHSTDGVDWTWITSENQAPEVFPGNSDRSTVVTTTFNSSFTARFLRITPMNWTNYPSLRFDVSGCYHVNENDWIAGHYSITPPVSLSDNQQYILKEGCRSTYECGLLCHQENTCHAFYFDHSRAMCHDVTTTFNTQVSTNTANTGSTNTGSTPPINNVKCWISSIFTSLGFREFPTGHTLYKINEQSLDQDGAADLCLQYHSQLFRITSGPQISSLQNIIARNTILDHAHNRLFVSGTYVAPDWRYSNGPEVIDSALWSPGNPDASIGHCVALTQTGLSSVDCTERFFSICG